jgi:hypothetical protein
MFMKNKVTRLKVKCIQIITLTGDDGSPVYHCWDFLTTVSIVWNPTILCICQGSQEPGLNGNYHKRDPALQSELADLSHLFAAFFLYSSE